MLAADFLKAYPREMNPERVNRDPNLSVLQDFRRYSYNYGLVVHAALRDEPEQIETLLAPIVEYETTHDFATLHDEVLADPQGWDYRNEIAFHELNDHMHGMWMPLVKGAWPNEAASEQVITTAMNSLAIQGLIGYAIREKLVQHSRGTEALYEAKNKKSVQALTGVMQEIDVAIVAMGIVRKMARTNPGITVVPAPMQFENSSPSANSDLLVIDMQHKRAVGIQTKTTVSRETVAKYDSDRVVLVDGSVDLGNVRVVRTTRGRSTEAVKPWPGIIAASRVHAIQMHGKYTRNIPPMARRENLLGTKLMAQELVGSLRVNHTDLQGAIGDRIASKL